MPWFLIVRRNVPNSQRGRIMPSQASRSDGLSGEL